MQGERSLFCENADPKMLLAAGLKALQGHASYQGADGLSIWIAASSMGKASQWPCVVEPP